MILAWRAASFGHAHRDPSVLLLDASTIHHLLASSISRSSSTCIHLAFLDETHNARAWT